MPTIEISEETFEKFQTYCKTLGVEFSDFASEVVETCVEDVVQSINWIGAIKAVRNYSGLGLKEAKELVDSVLQGREMVVSRNCVGEGNSAEFTKELDKLGVSYEASYSNVGIAKLRIKYGF